MSALCPQRVVSRSATTRAFTLLEVMVAVGVLAMISTLIYGAFDGLAKGKKGLGQLNDRYHQGRAAMERLSHELASAYLSLHQPLSPSLIRRKTAFVGTNSAPADRIDFTSFSHRRLVRDSHESDQNELSYFGSADPKVPGKIDLVRREAAIIDMEPRRGGEVLVLVDDIDLFDVKFLDWKGTMQWLDTWDTTQATGQYDRLPYAVKITLVLKGVDGKPISLMSKVRIPMVTPLNFAGGQ